MIKKLIIILELAVLLFLLFWHLKLGLVRYFDADEFAHLHWGYSFSIGEKPYTDFFYLFPPFFLYPVAAIFKIFGRSIQAILAARMFMFFTFLSTCGALFLLARKLRSVNFALFAVIFFAFLPLPFDKLIEVRPDLVATMFSLLGMYLFIKGDNKKYFFLSGLSYAVGLGFVPKTVFFLVPVGVVIAVSYLRNLGNSSRLDNGGNNSHGYPYFFLGIALVGLALLAVIASFGNLSLSIYSMTRMASEVTRTLGMKFYMRPDLFFYPNETYYGLGGWSMPIVINLIIYISASIWAIGRFISSLSHTDNRKCVREFLMAGSFWANLVAFVFIYPLKHAQYLIPVAPFIAFYFMDLWDVVVNKLFKSLKLLRIGVTLTLLFFLCLVGFRMNQKKEEWDNKPAFAKINHFMQIIPERAAVYDLTGESVFFQNGYYFCCLPYGQYEEAIYFKIPDIEKEMKKRNTKYVYVGKGDRINQISLNHAKYIKENFVPEISDKALWVRKIN